LFISVFDKASQCKKVEELVECGPQDRKECTRDLDCEEIYQYCDATDHSCKTKSFSANVECEKFLLKINEINKTLSDEAKNAIGVYNHIGANKIWPDKTGGPVFLLIKNQQINLMWYARYYGWMVSVYRQDIMSWETLNRESIIRPKGYCEYIVKDSCCWPIEECRNWIVEVNNGNGTSMEEANVNIECEKVVTRRKVKPNKTY